MPLIKSRSRAYVDPYDGAAEVQAAPGSRASGHQGSDGATSAPMSEKLAENMSRASSRRPPGLKDFFGVSPEFYEEEEFTLTFFGDRVAHPTSRLCTGWKHLVALVTIYFLFSIPLRISFNFQDYTLWLVFDYLCDLVLLFDIYLNFHTAFYIETVLVTDLGEIKENYKRTNMSWDIFASIPLDFLAFAFGLEYVGILRLNRLARLYVLDGIFSRTQLLMRFNPALLRVGKLSFFVIAFAHWIGCFWFGITRLQGTRATTWAEGTATDDDVASQYLVSLYWAVTVMTTVGFGDIHPVNNTERAFTIFAMLGGATMYAAVFGNMANLMASLDLNAENYRQKISTISRYMRYRRLPPALQTRILQYYDVLWSRHGGLDESAIFSELPAPLRSEVSLFLNRDLVKRVPLFHGCDSAGFINSLVNMLTPSVAIPGEYVIRHGDIGREMYFVRRGHLQAVAEDGKTVFSDIRDGLYFGEIALLFESRRTASVRAATYCDLLVLTKKDFDKVLEFFPGYAHIMRQSATEKIREKIRDGNYNSKMSSYVSRRRDEIDGDGNRGLAGELADSDNESAGQQAASPGPGGGALDNDTLGNLAIRSTENLHQVPGMVVRQSTSPSIRSPQRTSIAGSDVETQVHESGNLPRSGSSRRMSRSANRSTEVLPTIGPPARRRESLGAPPVAGTSRRRSLHRHASSRQSLNMTGTGGTLVITGGSGGSQANLPRIGDEASSMGSNDDAVTVLSPRSNAENMSKSPYLARELELIMEADMSQMDRLHPAGALSRPRSVESHGLGLGATAPPDQELDPDDLDRKLRHAMLSAPNLQTVVENDDGNGDDDDDNLDSVSTAMRRSIAAPPSVLIERPPSSIGADDLHRDDPGAPESNTLGASRIQNNPSVEFVVTQALADMEKDEGSNQSSTGADADKNKEADKEAAADTKAKPPDPGEAKP